MITQDQLRKSLRAKLRLYGKRGVRDLAERSGLSEARITDFVNESQLTDHEFKCLLEVLREQEGA